MFWLWHLSQMCVKCSTLYNRCSNHCMTNCPFVVALNSLMGLEWNDKPLLIPSIFSVLTLTFILLPSSPRPGLNLHAYWLVCFPWGFGDISQQMESTGLKRKIPACVTDILVCRNLSLSIYLSFLTPIAKAESQLWLLRAYDVLIWGHFIMSCIFTPSLHFWVPHSSSAYSKFHEISPPFSPAVLLHEEVAQLQEEVHLLRQMKDMLSKDLEETQGGCSTSLLSATELRVQLGDKEQELDRAKEALQGQRSTQASCHLSRAPSFLQLQQIHSK